MDYICPVCNQKLNMDGQCNSCGYREYTNYEKYMSLGSIPADIYPIEYQRILREKSEIEWRLKNDTIIEKYVSRDKNCSSKHAEAKNYEEILEDEPVVRYENCAMNKGDTYTFGYYGGEAIKWLILDVQDNKALLISEKGLDCLPFDNHPGGKGSFWPNCSLRSWLNNDFYNEAFPEYEKNRILNSEVSTQIDIKNRQITNDKLFLLDIEEIKSYLSIRSCAPSKHAKANNAYTDRTSGNGWYWTRSTSYRSETVQTIRVDGRHYSRGESPDILGGCVRPAFWLDLSINRVHKNGNIGDAYIFGKYANEAIRWKIVDTVGSNVLLLCDKAIEILEFNTYKDECSWKNSHIRSWLNKDFYETVFTELEKQRIRLTRLVNSENPNQLNTDEASSVDKVFLLNISEKMKYADEGDIAQCDAPSHVMHSRNYIYHDHVCWWLRSPGVRQNTVAYVNINGEIFKNGTSPVNTHICVRPAIWVSDVVSYTVTSHNRE